ncbi:MAG: MFS transporter [Deltaproteobacteria bacterium]|nr:MFS transporter [Deltaproteobacteria bacterium]
MTAQDGLPFSRRLVPVGMVTGIFFVNIASRVVLGPLMPAIEKDLGIGHAQAGGIFLLLAVAYCVGLLGAGFVSARLTHRTTIALSAGLMAVVLLGMGATTTLAGLRVAVVFLGLVAGLYLSSGVSTVTSLVDARDWGKALSMHEIAPNLAFTLAPLFAEALLQRTSWRGAMVTLGFLSLTAGVGFALWGQGGRTRGQQPSWGDARSLIAKPAFWILFVLFALSLGTTMGVYSMMPLYLTSALGFTRGGANVLVAASRAVSVATIFGAGLLVDRLGHKRAMMVVLVGAGALTLLIGVASAQWIVPVAILQPIIGAWFFPAAFAALSALSPLAVSFAVPFAMALGSGVVPAVIGFLGERHAFGPGFVLVGALCLGGALLAARLPGRPGAGPSGA